jgi:hypothetical protein
VNVRGVGHLSSRGRLRQTVVDPSRREGPRISVLRSLVSAGSGYRTVGLAREPVMNATKPRPGQPTGTVPRHGHDLRVTPLPVATIEDWYEPEAALQALYHRAEEKAIETINWYLATKRPKKRASRLLRAAAIVFGSAGALEPIATAHWLGSAQAEWGYLLLGCAAACVAFDRFFGISTGWMRSMQSAQRLEAQLEEFQYDWAAAYAAGAGKPLDVVGRLALLRAFVEGVTRVVQGETAEWVKEFSSNLAQLDAQTSRGDANRRSQGQIPDTGQQAGGAAGAV